MKIAAIIVTRGDHPEGLIQIAETIPEDWTLAIWDNGKGQLHLRDAIHEVPDLSVYGRYAAIEYTDADLIYVQDDDCVVSDPAAFPKLWELAGSYPWDGRTDEPWGSDPRDSLDHVVCNMPTEFRHEFYEDHALVGFGACFDRALPWTTWGRLTAVLGDAGFPTDYAYLPSFLRTCDIALTALNPRVLVDVPKENLPYAYHYDRMYRQPEHQAERASARELLIEVRDA